MRNTMSSHKAVHKQYRTILLVLLYIIGTLLPNSTGAAVAQATPCGESSAAAAAVADAVPAGDQQVKLSKEEVDYAAYEALWKDRYSDAEKVMGIFFEYLALSGSANMPWVKINQEFITKFSQAIPPADLNNQNLYSYDDILHTAFDVALTIPEVQYLVPGVWEKISNVNSPDSDAFLHFGDSATKVSASAWRYSQAARMMTLSSEMIRRARDCAKENPEYAATFDARHADKLNASINDSALIFLENNPDVAFPTELRGKIAADGTITISVDELKAVSEQEFEKLHATIDDIQESLVEIDNQQKVIVDYIKNQELKEEWQKKMKAQADEYQLQLDASKASITVISTLLNQLDPKLGKSLTVVATSTLQVGQALNGWLKATSGLNGLDKVTSLSTIVMTGNVLGAVMNVVALFGEQEPSLDQQILQQIGKLRQQVDQLRTEMHSRFDRIDAGLNSIYTTMQERFGQVDVQLGEINGKLDEVQQSLAELDRKLSRIEYNTFEMLNALGRRPLLEAINGGLNYLETTGEPMPYEPNFVEFANILYTWGTLHAFDALEAGPSQTDYSDANVIAVLNAYGTDSNINYFNGWLVTHGLPAITDKRIASPRDWLLASRAFTQLGIEWPEHMGRYNAQRQVDLDKVGADIQAAMLNISTITTPQGPQGNHLLFSNVITNYQNKLDTMMTAIQTQVETPFIDEVRSQRLHQSASFDLYGGVDQKVAHMPSNLSLTNCGLEVSLSAPQNLKAMIPDFDRYNLAEYLQLGSFSTCVDGGLSNVEEVCQPKTGECYTHGILRVGAQVSFEGVEFASLGANMGAVVLGADDDLTTYIVNNWDAIRAKLEQDNTQPQPTPQQTAQRAALLATTTTKIHNKLVALQHELYGRVLHAITQGSLQPLAVELAGSKALLHSFVTLGLSRAVANDEFLRAMLFGNQQLVEENQILQSYAISASQPITEVNLLVNPRLVIKQTASDRTDAFGDLLDEYLDAITAGTHTESPDYISSLRRMLDLTVRLAHLDVQTPPVTPMPSGTPGTPMPPGTQGTPTPPVTPVPSGTPITPEPPVTPSADAKRVYMPSIER